jgi:hypothetical protein
VFRDSTTSIDFHTEDWHRRQQSGFLPHRRH